MAMSEQIVEQATRLFAARGFDGASLQDIAEAVGLRKPTLLYHFASKEELRRAVLERLLAHWQETVPRLLKAANTGKDRFESLIDETMRFFSDDPDRARMLLRELLDRPAEVGALISEHLQPWLKLLADYIRGGQERGEIHDDVDPESYVLQVVSLILTTIAADKTVGALGALLGGNARAARSRQAAEVKRIAFTSLFKPLPDRRKRRA